MIKHGFSYLRRRAFDIELNDNSRNKFIVEVGWEKLETTISSKLFLF